MSPTVPSQRKKEKVSHGSKWLTPFLFISISIVFIVGYIGIKAFFVSSYFRVREIRWGGVHQIDPSALNERFRFVLGRSLVYLDLSEIHTALQSNGWIKKSVVRKVFPDRIDVTITERVAVAVELDPSSNKMVLRDKEGVIIEEVVESESGGLPRMIYYNPRAYAKALELAPLLSERPEALINLSRPDDVWVYLKGGVLRLGDRDYQKRWNQFVQVEPDIKHRGLAPWEADLRFPSKVVVRKKPDPVAVASSGHDIEY
jgi:cell division septal protein FtsQ